MSSDGGEAAVVRKRYQGSAEDLARALRPFVAKRGVSFCTYACEAMRPGYSKLVHGDAGIEGQTELLALLRSLSVNLAFPRSTMLRALKILQKELRSSSPSWNMDKAQISDWAETLQRRIRNCCRQCMQGELKSAKSAWVQALPWRVAPQSRRVSCKRPAAALETPKATEYTYGWNTELMLPWRRSVRLGAKEEPGYPIEVSEDAGASDALVEARWPDGHVAVVTEMTHGALRLASRGSNVAPSQGLVWEGEHEQSRHRVTVQQRVDRSLLLSMYEQGRQILMTRLDKFAEVQDQHHQVLKTHPALIAVAAMMVPLAQRYCKGLLKREDLNKHRDEYLANMTVRGEKAARRSAAAAEKSKPLGPLRATSEAEVGGGNDVSSSAREERASSTKRSTSSPCGKQSRRCLLAPPPTAAMEMLINALARL
jgi:hypothetical protein